MRLINQIPKYFGMLVRLKIWQSPLLILGMFLCQATFAAGPEFECDGTAYPVFGSPSELQSLDKETLATTSIGYISPSESLNAVGYNILDNYIYGLRTSDKTFVQIAADATYTELGTPTGTGVSAGVTWSIGATTMERWIVVATGMAWMALTFTRSI